MRNTKFEFTEDANKALEEEIKYLRDELKEKAIQEAFMSRGEPIEVVANDVRKAQTRLTRQTTELKASTELVLRAYVVIGLMTIMIGIISIIISTVGSGINPVYLYTILIGVLLVATAYMARYILQQLIEIRRRRAIRDIIENSKLNNKKIDAINNNKNR